MTPSHSLYLSYNKEIEIAVEKKKNTKGQFNQNLRVSESESIFCLYASMFASSEKLNKAKSWLSSK
jgi:hypothetical protein